MQSITPALEAILKARFQAGASGFRGKIEVDVPADTPLTCPVSLASRVAATLSADPYPGYPPGTISISITPTTTSLVLGLLCMESTEAAWNAGPAGTGSWTTLYLGGRDAVSGSDSAVQEASALVYQGGVAAGATAITGVSNYGPFGYRYNHAIALAIETAATSPVQYAASGILGAPISDVTLSAAPTAGNLLVLTVSATFLGSSVDPSLYASGWTLVGDCYGYVTGPFGMARMWIKCAGASEPATVQFADSYGNYNAGLSEWVISGETEALETYTHHPKTIAIDKSLGMEADEATIELENEGLPLGWGDTSVFPTNSRCRVYQWFGDEANAIRTFTGLIDTHLDGRDLLTVTLTCRDMMALLLDDSFSTVGPQGADEDGAVRTEANGVYLNREVSYIVNDILDRVGWPTADRAIDATSYTLAEYILADGDSWAASIVGIDRLAGLVSYSAWADELGVFHFARTYQAGSLTDPVTPVYTFEAGTDILDLGDSTDQLELRTRVKVRGPLTTTTLTDTWRQVWSTNKFRYPVGLWYDPTDSANLRVIDRGTKYLYTLRQSDRAVISKVYMGTAIAHPLGLSGDPSDSTIYWVLNCPWIDGGASTGNQVMKVRKSDDHVLATYSLPNGRWSAIKVSGSYLWLTNLDTDRFYSRSKADATAVADYSHKYDGNPDNMPQTGLGTTQLNPAGMMIDGTTLSIFWTNSGTTARFLRCDESAPGTVTGVVTTAGTTLHGGEMDTTTHTECYGDSDSLGLVAKFTLFEAVDQTTEVYAEVSDQALEDELGALAQVENRIHDTHSGDAAHPYEIRRDTVDLTAVLSLAQATQTAMDRLDMLAQRTRSLDVGIVANPALQKTDPIRVQDPISGLASDWLVHTYRTLMTETYVGTIACLPVATPSDDPTDGGSVT